MKRIHLPNLLGKSVIVLSKAQLTVSTHKVIEMTLDIKQYISNSEYLKNFIMMF